MEKLQGIYLPYDIDDTVYYMEKIRGVGGIPKYKIIRCYVFGYYNFGDGWKMKLHSNRNKYKYMEYDIPIVSNGYVVFETKKQAEQRIREIGGIIEG